MRASRPSSADPIEVFTAEQRPDLWERSRSLFETVWPEYNIHGNHTVKYFGTLYPKHASLQVPAGRAPLSVRDGVGSYWEPNIWMLHHV